MRQLNRNGRVFLWVLALLPLCVPGPLALATPQFYPAYTAVAPGLDYAHVTETNKPWSIHIARINRSEKHLRLLATLAKGHIEGLSTVAEQARAIDPRVGEPLLAVNGDFFVIKTGPYQGDPLGLQIVGGELVSGPGQASFWITGRQPHIQSVQSRFEVSWPDGARIAMGLNESPAAKPAVLFTPAFGASTRATNSYELELEPLRKRSWLPLRPDEHYRARIKAIHPEGNSPLMPGEMVLTVTNSATNHVIGLAPGKVIQFTTMFSQRLGKTEMAIGGGPMLIEAGRMIRTNSTIVKKSNSLVPRHPRTALGYNARYYFLVEVDGRQPALSMGMNLIELAGLMKDLGCTEAMNLDGGGSSTFWLEGRIMNSPSDKHERAVANAIVVVRSKK